MKKNALVGTKMTKHFVPIKSGDKGLLPLHPIIELFHFHEIFLADGCNTV